MLKLKTLDDNPEWKDRFCKLPSSMDPAAVTKILELNISSASEAFFIETDTGEYCGRIFLHGSDDDKKLGHFNLFCLSGSSKYQDDFIQLWPEIEDWFRYYGVSRVTGPLFVVENSPIDLGVFQRLGFKVEESCTGYDLISKVIDPS